MQTIIWLLRAAIFLLLLGFAIKNDGLVTVHAFFGGAWQTPLVVVILVSFALGVLLGATAIAASMLSLHRELRRLRRQVSVPGAAPVRSSVGDAGDLTESV
ncbi:MAG: hypothetical protein CGU28_14860 [Candidatus Dactylopiibacterium carminicum]|uniref:DUF1049 domain-containing protein n=1 Tax=Candidatus Dactylopiibacterium carminicum TaxID=857335 RepID=A0A272ENK2_9RHOO|nr:LapA family protein [Candidatus Dactylopiibacterium carminicum]KAF7598088.1 DUF1049 domain-containing protein [Candidatus Dactylopiibacterium carminicum]PAS91683.1 MAG: hypothetical protein CGU29_15105 [Candidatus Dactylopiibacterium carminicum]PAS93684.1 MAG: hypothetical protein CGU28_14860 [Candidatus Dactylopiibacterium carminicum]PAS96574.1 MAG: hypothetical protein BSR46_15260 [Candidatus Dactylopiibacterium carminicum]